MANRALGTENGYDYEAVPNTGHLQQIERPDACAEILHALPREAPPDQSLKRAHTHGIDSSRQRNLQGHVRHRRDAPRVLRRQSARPATSAPKLRSRSLKAARALSRNEHADDDRRARRRLSSSISQLLKAEAENVGYPILGLVRQLSAACGEAGRYVHWGATTQDIMDTGVVLQVREALAIVERDIAAVSAALDKLARKYRDTPMAGRTHLQQALPITFGYKCAIWLSMMQRHAERLAQLKPRVLVAQLGGAAGTLASLGDQGPRRARRLCRRTRPRRARDHLARRPRRPCRSRAVPGPRHRLARQDRLRRHADDDDRDRRGVRAVRQLIAALRARCRRSAIRSPPRCCSPTPRPCASRPA